MSYETVDTTTPPATADGSVGVTEPEIVVLQDVLPADAELRDAELQVSITFMHPSTTILIAASAMPPGAGESMVTAMPDLAMSMADSRNQVSTSQVLGQGASDYSRRLSNLLARKHNRQVFATLDLRQLPEESLREIALRRVVRHVSTRIAEVDADNGALPNGHMSR